MSSFKQDHFTVNFVRYGMGFLSLVLIRGTWRNPAQVFQVASVFFLCIINWRRSNFVSNVALDVRILGATHLDGGWTVVVATFVKYFLHLLGRIFEPWTATIHFLILAPITGVPRVLSACGPGLGWGAGVVNGGHD